MNLGLKIHKKDNKNFENELIDKITLFLGLGTPFFVLPQIYISIFLGEFEGLSLISWITFFFNHLFWFFYGYIHKIKILFWSSLLWVLFQGFLISGVVYLKYFN